MAIDNSDILKIADYTGRNFKAAILEMVKEDESLASTKDDRDYSEGLEESDEFDES